MDDPKTILDLVLDPVESDRVKAILDLLAQTENYTRAVSLVLGGLAAQANDADARLIFAAQRHADEISNWLGGHCMTLATYGQQAEPAMTQEQQTVTVH